MTEPTPQVIQGTPEPEPLVIQILIGAEVKIRPEDIGHIKELKKEIEKAIDEYTDAGYFKNAMWPYLIKPDTEITFSDEGSFEYMKGKQEKSK